MEMTPLTDPCEKEERIRNPCTSSGGKRYQRQIKEVWTRQREASTAHN